MAVLPHAVLRCPITLFRRFAWPPAQPNLDVAGDLGAVSEPFRTVTDDGVVIRGSLLWPADPWGTVVICHGRGANTSRTHAQARLLWEQGLAVASFDFRGCGASGSGRGWRDSLWAPLGDLEAVVRHVEERVAGDPRLRGRIALLGCSFGGNMVVAHAGAGSRRYPALVLDSTPLVRWRDMLDDLLRKERRGARWARLRGVVDWLVVRSVVVWTRADALYRHAERSVRNLDATPVLHIVGDRDTLFDVEESCRFLFANHPGVVRVWRVPRARHLTNHIVDARGYAAQITAHLSAAYAATTPGRHHVRHTTG